MKGLAALIWIVVFTWAPLYAHGREKVVLQLQWLPQFQFAGYYMAKEMGFYKAAGLDVEIRPMHGGVDVETEVLSGRAQYGTGRSSLLIAYDQKKPVVAMAAIFQSTPMVLLVRADSNIHNLEDLRGKRVMLTNDVQSAASIQAMLRNAGMAQDDIIWLPHSFDPVSLENNETDAMASYVSNEPYVLMRRGVQTRAIDPKAYGYDFYSDILFTSQGELAQYPERARRFYEASLEGWRYAFDHIDETAKVLYEKYNPQHKSLEALRFEGEALKPFALNHNVPLGHISLDRLKAIYQIYSLLGYTGGADNPDAFIYHPERLVLTAKEKAWLSDHPVIRLGVDPAWPPVEFIAENGTVSGITSGYLKAISEKLGIRIDVERRRTWEEVERGMQVHTIDMATAMMNTPQRRSYALFTRPYLILPVVIVGGRSFKYVGDLSALKGKRVAVARSYATEAMLKRDFPEIELVGADTTAEALRQVAFGKADATVGALAVVSYLIAEEGLTNLRIVGQTPYNFEIAIGVRSDWPELRNLMQKALDSIGEQEREAIYHRWVPTVYEHEVDYALLWKILAVIAVIAVLFGYKYVRLDNLVKKRTRELEELNATLNERIGHAVEENRSQERLMIQQAKMATIGEMIESIAHQWRQPLNIMGIGISNLDLKRQLGTLEPGELDNLIELVHRQVSYMSQTIDDFRNFFRKDKALEYTCFRPLVNEVVSLVNPVLRQKGIRIEVHVPDGLCSNVFPNELKQVILNLINNAKDALIQREGPGKRIVIRADAKKGTLRLEVEDNGGGVPAEIMEKIFEPYFTTKFGAQGTGIGLYMSKVIVEKNLRGHIAVLNKKEGACFIITLPMLPRGSAS